MRKILFSRWLLSFIGTAILAALVWVFGPFIPALETWLPRAAIIGVLFLVWAAANAVIDWRGRARDKALTEGVVAADPAAAASADEAAALGEGLSRAMSLLKTRAWCSGLSLSPTVVHDHRAGAGKTTALLNAGLRFPLAERRRADPGRRGHPQLRLLVPPTRPRWSTPPAATPRRTRTPWSIGSLGLRSSPCCAGQRPLQPMNGMLVAIGAGRSTPGSARARLRARRAIRRRLKELARPPRRSSAGLRSVHQGRPVAGFSEYFDDLDREKRAQVWGTTFPVEKSEAGPVGRFPAAFDSLVERLDARDTRSYAGRAQPRPARSDRRLPGPDGQPGRAVEGVPGGRFCRLPPRPGADVARRVSDLRNAAGYADRPLDRRAVAWLRHRPAAHAKPAPRARTQLLPDPPAVPRGARRSHAGIRTGGYRAAASHRAERRLRRPGPGRCGRLRTVVAVQLGE